MAIIKGLLKDKLGNQLYPETSFDQVKADDGKTLKVWRGEIDGKVSTYDGLLDVDGTIKLEKLPAVLRACLETHLSIMKRFNSMLAMAI